MIEHVVDVTELFTTPKPEELIEGRLEARILRRLYSRATVPEGQLANELHGRITPTWNECVERLLAAKMIHVLPVLYQRCGNPRRIALTELGIRWAKVLCSNR